MCTITIKGILNVDYNCLVCLVCCLILGQHVLRKIPQKLIMGLKIFSISKLDRDIRRGFNSAFSIETSSPFCFLVHDRVLLLGAEANDLYQEVANFDLVVQTQACY